jgi:hypothetical protein
VAFVASALFVYVQYLENSVDSQIDRAERDMSDAIGQLSSSEAGIRSAGVRTLYAVSFRPLPAEPSDRWYAPVINLYHWVFRRGDLRFLPRGRALFKDFAATPRAPSERQRDIVSTMIAQTALDWLKRERQLAVDPSESDSTWFFFRAYLPGAYLPSADLEGMQLFETNFSGATLSGTSFQNAFAQRSNFRNANVETSDFTNANLIGADFTDARMNFAKLDHAQISQRIFGPGAAHARASEALRSDTRQCAKGAASKRRLARRQLFRCRHAGR